MSYGRNEDHRPNGNGYCPDYGSADKTDGKTLILHPIDSEIVRLVFTWYQEGTMSDSLVAERLNNYQFELPDGTHIAPRQQGHPGKTEPGPFRKDVIRDMLNRIFYTGKLPYHTSHGLGSRRTLRSKLGEAELFDGQHPAIIDISTYRQVQELRNTLGRNCRTQNGFPIRIFPLSGLLRCGYCGNTMRGVSSMDRRYYRDSSQIEHVCDCPQETVRADELEDSFYKMLTHFVQEWGKGDSQNSQEVALFQTKARFERAKEMYLQGEITRSEFQDEKSRFEGATENTSLASLSDLNERMETLKQSLKGWAQVQAVDKKKLHRRVVRAVYLRGTQVVAVQPTPEYLPLFQEKSCSCGEGGRGAKRYNYENFIAPISFAEVLLRLEHKLSEAIVG